MGAAACRSDLLVAMMSQAGPACRQAGLAPTWAPRRGYSLGGVSMKRVVVIGLGIFGINLVKQLYESGLEVLAIDKRKEAVQESQGFLHQSHCRGWNRQERDGGDWCQRRGHCGHLLRR